MHPVAGHCPQRPQRRSAPPPAGGRKRVALCRLFAGHVRLADARIADGPQNAVPAGRSGVVGGSGRNGSVASRVAGRWPGGAGPGAAARAGSRGGSQGPGASGDCAEAGAGARAGARAGRRGLVVAVVDIVVDVEQPHHRPHASPAMAHLLVETQLDRNLPSPLFDEAYPGALHSQPGLHLSVAGTPGPFFGNGQQRRPGAPHLLSGGTTRFQPGRH
mmetsp:Transcript_16975/g.46634  ORF Transcript_16975/g.46634 Transcript_16975/m.46634 type:complete len:217 (+) Transcript_16975:853-1503(+)